MVNFLWLLFGKMDSWRFESESDNTSCWTVQIQIARMASASGHPDNCAVAKRIINARGRSKRCEDRLKTSLALEVSHEPFLWQTQNRSSESCLKISQREKEKGGKILSFGLSLFRYPRLNTFSHAKNHSTTDLHQWRSKIYFFKQISKTVWSVQAEVRGKRNRWAGPSLENYLCHANCWHLCWKERGNNTKILISILLIE